MVWFCWADWLFMSLIMDSVISAVNNDWPSSFVKVVPTDVAEALELVEVLLMLLMFSFFCAVAVDMSVVSEFWPVFPFLAFFRKAGKLVGV
jgi:hypothetical protein